MSNFNCLIGQKMLIWFKGKLRLQKSGVGLCALFVSIFTAHLSGVYWCLSRFHVPFWLSHILVNIFYLCPTFCPS